MPRDFVPCEYTERLFEDGQTKRCQVIECFEGVHLVTRDTLFTLGLDSHAYCLDTVLGDGSARADLFDTFYAAMAALE